MPKGSERKRTRNEYLAAKVKIRHVRAHEHKNTFTKLREQGYMYDSVWYIIESKAWR